MIGIDTNILVRYVTNDHPEQAALAVELLGQPETILVANTVLLELEWVLRSVYDLKPSEIHQAMLQILGLPNVMPEDAEQVAVALSYYQRGMDFADALHLAINSSVQQFYTFDKAFVKRAGDSLPIVTLLVRK